ncbi:hypothetical protein [Herbaspirillum lusitanum]|nr:hypothetical protein [Herbaspirillum lusitanum]
MWFPFRRRAGRVRQYLHGSIAIARSAADKTTNKPAGDGKAVARNADQ